MSIYKVGDLLEKINSGQVVRILKESATVYSHRFLYTVVYLSNNTTGIYTTSELDKKFKPATTTARLLYGKDNND